MLSVTHLLNGTATPGDALRYGRDTKRMPAHMLHYSKDKKPIVVWNCTRRCNLHCMHCYSSSENREYPGELTTEQGKKLIDDLADFGVPTLLLSGGEPLMRSDVVELGAYARQKGLRVVLSTNGTLIDREMATRLKGAGLAYVGISIDGMREVHDKIRGVKGAFDKSIQALRYCREEGIRVGLRFTVHAQNIKELPAVFKLMEDEGINRMCVYHLAYAGRGERIQRFDLTPPETRGVVKMIFDQSEAWHKKGIDIDLLTADNHADNVMMYWRIKEKDPERAEDVLQMLRWNGGNQSGIAITSIDPLGEVHADQFSWNYSFGNVKERPFGEIWMDASDPRMAILKDRAKHLKGRCAVCKWRDICNGSLRARAESYFGDWLAPDPGCYLTDAEIGLKPGTPEWEVAHEFIVPVQEREMEKATAAISPA